MAQDVRFSAQKQSKISKFVMKTPYELKTQFATGQCCAQQIETTFLQDKQTPWSESESELYRPSDRRLSAK
jgi:hypothetical protein